MVNPREEAVNNIENYLSKGSWINKLINTKYNSFKDPRDFDLHTELSYGTLKHLLKIRAIVNSKLRKHNFDSLSYKEQAILLVSLYELLYLNNIPDYATIHSYVEIAKKVSLSFSKLVNGILRNIQKGQTTFKLESFEEFSINPELLKYLSKTLEASFLQKFLNFTLSNHPTYVRIDDILQNPDCSSNVYFENFGLKNVLFDETFMIFDKYRFAKNSFKNVVYQDLSTQIAQHLIPYVPRGTYLDVTSAPALKASFLATIYKDVTVISNDINFEKLKHAKQRFNLPNLLFTISDGTSCSFKTTFDVVILDAPCSGLGTIRRKPELRYKMTPNKIKELITLQRDLLNCSKKMVKPSGALVYMTCTINPNENEKQIENFLKQNPDFIIENMPVHFESYMKRSEFGVYVDGFSANCDFFYISILRRGER